MDIKKTLKWGGLIILVWIVFILANTAYIRDWRIKYSEQRVQKSIVKNYEDKKKQFKTLIEYVRKLDIFLYTEIEFIKNGKINGYINSSFVSDTMQINSTTFDLNWLDIEDERMQHPEFEFLPDGKVKISYGDTIFETNNWFWNFEGTTNNPKFEKFINYIGISKRELETLRSLIREVDCEAISINENGSFSLRYDGFRACQYEYFIPTNTMNEYRGYSKLAEGIFCGLNRWDLFCGSVIYNK
jgi:hypothetical protein